MDWKYKHFHQARDFAATADAVDVAARTFFIEQLGWQISDSADGFVARGYSFAHQAIADVHRQSMTDGTRVTIELKVQRASALGFMLFDVGGYYSIQMRTWLDGIEWSIGQALNPGKNISPNPLVLQANKPSAHIFNGCLVFIAVMFGLWIVITLICAVVGLATGNLLLIGRSGSSTIHGTAARVISALILVVAAFVVWRINKPRRQRPAILP